MTRTPMSTSSHAQLYETDFVEWLGRASELLKQGLFNELDVENLIEEVEDLGRSQKQALRSNLRVLLMHLLKWQYQAENRSNSWTSTIDEHRDRIHDLIEDSPSLKNQLLEVLGTTYEKARKRAFRETGLEINTFPTECPYTLEQVLDDDFWPES